MSDELDLAKLVRRVIRETGPGTDEGVSALASVRTANPNQAGEIDRILLGQIRQMQTDLRDVRQIQRQVAQLFESLKAAPWYPAVFTGCQQVAGRTVAIVLVGGALRVVPAVDTIDLSTLDVGDEVLLGNEQNLVVARSSAPSFRSGETAVFDRFTSDGRVVIKSRDEEIVVAVAGSLPTRDLHAGDRIRWDRSVWLAYERLDAEGAHPLFLEEMPTESFDQVGGLDGIVGRLQRSISLHVDHKSLVRKYGLRRCSSVLFSGPPGNGKTLLARALANWLGAMAPSGKARFMHIKPGALNSMWYSASEANYREAFRVAREAGELEPDIPVVMFFDEVDAVGHARGTSHMQIDDRVQTALMAELDGLESRGNILVVAATNRMDALDPALVRPGRLGDLVLEIPRPNRKGARAIFARHLPADLPYHSGDHATGASARQAIIDAALARVYGHGPETQLATITFRDGKQREVRARDVITGASIAKVASEAVERACFREKDTGEEGIRALDLVEAVSEECARAASVLTPANCRVHLDGLPQDVDVVRIEPARPRIVPERYLSPVA